MSSQISKDVCKETLLNSQHLIAAILEEDFFLDFLLDDEDEYRNDILIEDCVFRHNFGFNTGYFHGNITIRNCEICGILMFHGMFTYMPITIEDCHVLGISQFVSGGFFNGIRLRNNTFNNFADFGDQDIRGKAIFINNRFNGGTNLMHPSGSPNGAQFEQPPYLEGNTGLERYVRPED